MRNRLFAIALIGCGGGGSSTPADDVVDPPQEAGVDTSGNEPAPGLFTVTSPAFTEGGSIPNENTCNGNNTSPQLDWSDPPAGTLSFAMVLTDKSNNLIHSVFYDIPASRTGLPADVDKAFAPADVPGMHTTKTLGGGNNFGYAGPCPPSIHTYEFAIIALDVATLPGLGMTTTQQQGKAAIDMHDIGTATLTGMYDPN